jgi:hypothetical protein
MCGNPFASAPKAPSLPPPPPPEPPAPTFVAGSADDVNGMSSTTGVGKTGKAALKTHDLGLGIPTGA